jgi:hypothetical protein
MATTRKGSTMARDDGNKIKVGSIVQGRSTPTHGIVVAKRRRLLSVVWDGTTKPHTVAEWCVKLA